MASKTELECYFGTLVFTSGILELSVLSSGIVAILSQKKSLCPIWVPGTIWLTIAIQLPGDGEASGSPERNTWATVVKVGRGI